MVPTEDLATYTSDLENRGFSILSTHNFNDIRGGDPQTLITWGTSSGDEFSRKCCFPTGGDNFHTAIWLTLLPPSSLLNSSYDASGSLYFC